MTKSPLHVSFLVISLLCAQPDVSRGADAPAATVATKVDLSTPVSTTRAFFAAMKAGDTATAEKTLGVRMQERITKQGQGVEGFLKGLAEEMGKLLSISDEAMFPKGGEAGDECKVPITIKSKGGDVTVHNVKLTRVNGQWLIKGF